MTCSTARTTVVKSIYSDSNIKSVAEHVKCFLVQEFLPPIPVFASVFSSHSTLQNPSWWLYLRSDFGKQDLKLIFIYVPLQSYF